MEQIVNETLFPERRMKPRINCDYPALMKGRDALGQIFAENARAINLSASGVYLVTQRSIQNNTEVHVKIALPTGSLEWGTSNLGTSGNVVRNEVQSDGAVGIAIKFHGYKLF
jgi:hypothetical protein